MHSTKNYGLFLLYLTLLALRQVSSSSSGCDKRDCDPVTCHLVSVCIPDSKLYRRQQAESRVKRDTLPTVQEGVIRMASLNASRGHYQLEDDGFGGVRFAASSAMGVIAKALETRTGMSVEVVRVSEEDRIIDLVNAGAVDIGAGLFNLMESRAELVEYSRFVGEDTFTILMKSEKHFSKADSLIAPFSRDVS